MEIKFCFTVDIDAQRQKKIMFSERKSCNKRVLTTAASSVQGYNLKCIPSLFSPCVAAAAAAAVVPCLTNTIFGIERKEKKSRRDIHKGNGHFWS